jgi:uncharacterized protein YecT (DUF1311 family)
MIRRHPRLTALPALASVLLAAAIATASAQDRPAKIAPSFDCATAAAAFEKAICGDAKLAELDLDMARYFKIATEGLNAADAAALSADQRAWLARRAAFFAEGAGTLKEKMEERVAALEGTILNAYPLLGVWVNHATSITIRDRRGLIIEPADERCSNWTTSDYVGDSIVVNTGPDGHEAENWSVRISRRGPLLKIEEIPPRRRGKAAPVRPCTGGASVAGLYFQKSRYLKRF